MCVLYVAVYGRNRLDITWHLMESISTGYVCTCMCTDLVGSSGWVEYDSPNVNRHGLSVVRYM